MEMSGDHTIGKANWSQGEDGDETLEIRVPIVLPASARPKDITVEVKDLAVLCVRHRETRILQWRLYEQVSAEVEWRVESDGTLFTVELTKRNPTLWPCLLDLPMPTDDELFLSNKELDALFREHYPALPVSRDHENHDSEQESKTNGEKNGDDLEKLLEEAAEEVEGAKLQDNSSEFIQTEIKAYIMEEEEIQKKLLEVTGALETNSDDAAKEAQKKKMLERMLQLHSVIRAKRADQTTLESFLEITQLEIRKARTNVGDLADEEQEEYASEAERAMTAHELMTTGLKHFEERDIQTALHFLRLAAIHHNHEQSTLILHDIYVQLESPRGAFLLLKRAMKDEELSAIVNLKVGEQFDGGARHFLPIFPAALYFYQRAAKAGNVNAMLAIAQLHLRGHTMSSMLSAKQINDLINTEKYHAWIQKAIDRGCGSAYFVKGCMHLKGEHGCEKSYKLAKEFLDRAASAQPDIARRAPQVYLMLKKLREEESGAEEKGLSSPLALTKTNQSEAAKNGANRNGGDSLPVSSSMERFNHIKGKPAAQGFNPSRSKKMMSLSTNAKMFWERAVSTGVMLYSFYTLAFPIRILLLPHFYTILGHVVDRVPWLGANPLSMQF